MKILVAEDNEDSRILLEHALAARGHAVEAASNGVDALELALQSRPDMVISDIQMPRMDGYEFAAHVRNDERVSDVPIIMITSRVGDKHRARAIEIGVNDYLGKPYQDTKLLEAIERLLEERGIQLS